MKQIFRDNAGALIHADDSSDEEVVKTRVDDFEGKSFFKTLQEDDYRGSQIAYNIGLLLLYSDDVNQSYYKKKQTLRTHFVDETLFNKWLDEALHATVNEILQHSRIEKTSLENIINDFFEQCSSTIESTKAVLQQIDKSCFLEGGNKAPITKALKPLQEKILSFAETIVRENTTLSFLPALSLRQLDTETRLKNCYANKANACAQKIATDNKWVKTNGKLVSKTIRSKSSPTGVMAKAIRDAFTEYQGSKTLINALNEKKDSIVSAYLRLKIARVKKASPSLLIGTSPNQTFKHNADLRSFFKDALDNPNCYERLDDYFDYSAERYASAVSYKAKNISTSFIAILETTRHDHMVHLMTRGTLTTGTHLSCSNASDILSNIRLINRSQRRTIRNKQDEGGSVYTQSNRTNALIFDWDDTHEVLETISVTKHYARNSHQQDISSYENIGAFIDQIRNRANTIIQQHTQGRTVTNADIARWIRQCANGSFDSPLCLVRKKGKHQERIPVKFNKPEEKQTKELLAQITHLLFVVEGRRNPASLVLHHMMLDLVEQTGISFKDGFKKLPMCPDNAVPKARGALQSYSGEAVVPYLYEGPEIKSAVDDFCKAQHKLYEEWVNKVADSTSLDITTVISAAKTRWFGVSLNRIKSVRDLEHSEVLKLDGIQRLLDDEIINMAFVTRLTDEPKLEDMLDLLDNFMETHYLGADDIRSFLENLTIGVKPDTIRFYYTHAAKLVDSGVIDSCSDLISLGFDFYDEDHKRKLSLVSDEIIEKFELRDSDLAGIFSYEIVSYNDLEFLIDNKDNIVTVARFAGETSNDFSHSLQFGKNIEWIFPYLEDDLFQQIRFTELTLEDLQNIQRDAIQAEIEASDPCTVSEFFWETIHQIINGVVKGYYHEFQGHEVEEQYAEEMADIEEWYARVGSLMSDDELDSAGENDAYFSNSVASDKQDESFFQSIAYLSIPITEFKEQRNQELAIKGKNGNEKRKAASITPNAVETGESQPPKKREKHPSKTLSDFFSKRRKTDNSIRH